MLLKKRLLYDIRSIGMEKELLQNFNELNKKHLANRDERIAIGEWCRSRTSEIKSEYDSKIEALKSEYESAISELEKKKAVELKKVTQESNYYGAIETEEKSKVALQKAALQLVKEQSIMNKEMCDVLESATGKKWNILSIAGPKIYDSTSGTLERIGLVCVNEDDPQFGRKVYLTKADTFANSVTPNTATCKVLLEGGVENIDGFAEKLSNINWTAVYVDYVTGATDMQRTINGIELAPTDMRSFRALVIDSLTQYLGLGGNAKIKD